MGDGIDGRWDRWEMDGIDGRWMGDGWEMDGRWMGDGWEMDGG